jgi:hypothetical protein
VTGMRRWTGSRKLSTCSKLSPDNERRDAERRLRP